MIDLLYVQARLDQVKVDSFLPLRSWVRDLLTKVRGFEKEEVKYKLAIEAYKALVSDLQTRMFEAQHAFDVGDFCTGMDQLEEKEFDDETG